MPPKTEQETRNEQNRSEWLFLANFFYAVISKLTAFVSSAQEEDIIIKMHEYICVLSFITPHLHLFTKKGFEIDGTIGSSLNVLHEEILPKIQTENPKQYQEFYKFVFMANEYIKKNDLIFNITTYPNMFIFINLIMYMCLNKLTIEDPLKEHYNNVFTNICRLETQATINYHNIMDLSYDLFIASPVISDNGSQELSSIIIDKIKFIRNIQQRFNIESSVNLITMTLSHDFFENFLLSLNNAMAPSLSSKVFYILTQHTDPVNLLQAFCELSEIDKFGPMGDDYSTYLIQQYICDALFLFKNIYREEDTKIKQNVNAFLEDFIYESSKYTLENKQMTFNLFKIIYFFNNIAYSLISEENYNRLDVCIKTISYFKEHNDEEFLILSQERYQAMFLSCSTFMLRSKGYFSNIPVRYADTLRSINQIITNTIRTIYEPLETKLQNDPNHIIAKTTFNVIKNHFEALTTKLNFSDTKFTEINLAKHLKSFFFIMRCYLSYQECDENHLLSFYCNIISATNYLNFTTIQPIQNLQDALHNVRNMIKQDYFNSMAIDEQIKNTLNAYLKTLLYKYFMENIYIQNLTDTEQNNSKSAKALIDFVVNFFMDSSYSMQEKAIVADLFQLLMMPTSIINDVKNLRFAIHPHKPTKELNQGDKLIVEYTKTYTATLLNNINQLLHNIKQKTPNEQQQENLENTNTSSNVEELFNMLNACFNWLEKNQGLHSVYFFILLNYFNDMLQYIDSHNQPTQETLTSFSNMVFSVINIYAKWILNDNSCISINDLLYQVNNTRIRMLECDKITDTTTVTPLVIDYRPLHILPQLSRFDTNITFLKHRNHSAIQQPQSVESADLQNIQQQIIKSLTIQKKYNDLQSLLHNTFNHIWQEVLIQHSCLHIYSDIMYNTVKTFITTQLSKNNTEGSYGLKNLSKITVCQDQTQEFTVNSVVCLNALNTEIEKVYQQHVANNFFDMLYLFFTNFFAWLSLDLDHCQQGIKSINQLFYSNEQNICRNHLSSQKNSTEVSM